MSWRFLHNWFIAQQEQTYTSIGQTSNEVSDKSVSKGATLLTCWSAIHAPLNVSWVECSNEAVFVGGNSGPETEGDTSPDPIQHVLPQVIEATNRVLIGNGDFDMIIITNGTLMSM